MAISKTTFEERLQRINNGEAIDQAAIVGRPKKRRSLRGRCFTFPFMVGVGILTGLPAYAWATTTQSDVGAVLTGLQHRLPDMQQWVVALAG